MNQPYPSDAKPLAVVAKLIGVHPVTLGRWVRAGELPGWKVGPVGWGRKRRVFVSVAAALALVVEPLVPRMIRTNGADVPAYRVPGIKVKKR